MNKHGDVSVGGKQMAFLNWFVFSSRAETPLVKFVLSLMIAKVSVSSASIEAFVALRRRYKDMLQKRFPSLVYSR